jgi:hypothetical protein
MVGLTKLFHLHVRRCLFFLVQNIGGWVDVLCTVSMILLMVRKSTISRMIETVHRISTKPPIFCGKKEKTSTHMTVKDFCQSDHCVKSY